MRPVSRCPACGCCETIATDGGDVCAGNCDGRAGGEISCGSARGAPDPAYRAPPRFTPGADDGRDWLSDGTIGGYWAQRLPWVGGGVTWRRLP